MRPGWKTWRTPGFRRKFPSCRGWDWSVSAAAGGRRPAVRIQANPTTLAAYGLTLEDLRTAIVTANVNQAKGGFDGPRRSFVIGANDQLLSSRDYRPVIIAYREGAPVRISDVADVIDDTKNVNQAAWMNETPAVIVNVQRQPGANVIQVAVESLSSFIGVDGTNTTLNSGRILINLKPRENRNASAGEVIERLQRELAKVSGISLFMQPVQDLTVDAKVSRTRFQYTLEDPDFDELNRWAPRLVDSLRALRVARHRQRPA